MRLNKFSFMFASIVLAAGAVKTTFADDVTIIGSISTTFKQASDKPRTARSPTTTPALKTIQLLHVQLSDEAKKRLENNSKIYLAKSRESSASLQATASSYPEKIELGMSNVPVLDQGAHGTCTTFAITGVLDATMAKGDYISQVCNLQLGNYLEKHGYAPSGWEGSHSYYVLGQIEQFGIVSKQKQRTLGCGGLKDYPTNSSKTPTSFIEPVPFKAMSELIYGQDVNWSTVFSNDAASNLNTVKEALNAGNRLAFGVLLPDTEHGTVGAVGKHNTWFGNDTWVLTPEIIKAAKNARAGHQMIISGYDDNAVATDDHGVKHKGLLTLRNSWGSSAGSNGDFYMSYDYFKLLTHDLTRYSSTH